VSDDAVPALIVALQATVHALTTGDIPGAAAAMAKVTHACAEAARTRAEFGPAQLAEARALHGRCAALADQTQAKVVAAVLQTSTQRKAGHAYGSSS
jgi:hypothetical protein